jgi:ATP phosphoribosyltransferase regulatory subunit HisZ
MGDLLPPEAAGRRALGRTLLETFARCGYDLVTTPPFEHAEVMERGLETVDRRDLLRFVEPDTGEVALLRPDITPQIARVIATRLADRPPPWRLCYEGTVIRRRRGRARRHRQIAQSGVECVGVPGPAGDAEVIGLAVQACAAIGLDQVRVELGQVHLGRAGLEAVPEALRAGAEDALAAKDRAELERLLERGGVRGADRAHLLGLTELYGGLDVLDRAARLFASRSERSARGVATTTCSRASTRRRRRPGSPSRSRTCSGRSRAPAGPGRPTARPGWRSPGRRARSRPRRCAPAGSTRRSSRTPTSMGRSRSRVPGATMRRSSRAPMPGKWSAPTDASPTR